MSRLVERARPLPLRVHVPSIESGTPDPVYDLTFRQDAGTTRVREFECDQAKLCRDCPVCTAYHFPGGRSVCAVIVGDPSE